MLAISPARARAFSTSSSVSPRRSRLFSAYGTFDGDGELDALPRHYHGNSLFRRRHPRIVSTLQVLGVLAVFVVTAASVVLQMSAKVSDPGYGRRVVEEPAPISRNRAAVPLPVRRVSAAEDAFLSGVDAKMLKEYLHEYAGKPHVAGSPQDYATAIYTAKQLESFGFQVTIEQYEPLLSVPMRQAVTIVAPENAKRVLNLSEAQVEGDACTSNQDALPPFLAYSASGDVTASVVYVNYGRQEDFAWLQAHGVSLEGKIALVRYGQNYRGLKIMLAEEHGMRGVLVYSDPEDDGSAKGATYPNGPWRPENSFQRGSAHYMSVYTGDPLTPGYAATHDAPRVSIDHATNLPHIPATVLSYEQARYLLAGLGGMTAPNTWQGSVILPEDGEYRIGDDTVLQVRMEIEVDNHIGPIWNVIGRIDGAYEQDQVVLVGNHRDAWVCGAVDPSSGSAALLELARGLGQLLQQGWQPRRTIVLASWDGEEHALLGSTEHAEDHESQLRREAVAYLNIDNIAGPLVGASGTPAIASYLLRTAKDVPADKFFGNETATTLYEQWAMQATARKERDSSFVKSTLAPDHLVQFLGSGTDFTPFYQHIGIVSANLIFRQQVGQYGVYHSSMDSITYLEKYADPLYATQVAATQWWGLLTMRLASEVLLPLDFTTYAIAMTIALDDLAQDARLRHLEVHFSSLRGAIRAFSTTAQLFHAQMGVSLEAFQHGKDIPSTITRWNHRLMQIERHFIAPEGLPHRPWYRHVIFGPGFYEGYGGTAFPGISDALVFGDTPPLVQAQVDRVASIIHEAAHFMQAEVDFLATLGDSE